MSATLKITTSCDAIEIPQAAAEFIAYSLGEGTVDLCRGAFGALGMNNEAEAWAYSVRLHRNELSKLHEIQGDLDDVLIDVLKGDTPEEDKQRELVDATFSRCQEAWEPLRDVINQCREYMGYDTI